MVGFGDRGSGAGLVDEVLAGGAGGDERGEGEPVDAAGFAAAGFVDERDGVVGEQRVGSTRELQVVVEVSGGFLAGHAGHGAAHGDALFECGQGAQGHFGGERGLAEKYCGERGFGVEPVIGQQPQRFQGIVGEEVGLVDAQDGDAAPFGCFGGQRVAGLRDEGGVVEAGPPAERGHDVVVDATGGDGGVGDVDQVVAGGFGAVDGGAGGDGLADADLAGDHGDAAGGDAVADAGGGLGVIAAAEQHAGCQGAAEGHGGEAEIGLDLIQHDGPFPGFRPVVEVDSGAAQAFSGLVWSWRGCSMWSSARAR